MPEQGITYGPAETRVTRTPISFGPMDSLEGKFNVANPLLNLPIVRNLVNAFSGGLLNNKGSIKVDPSQGDVGLTTRHEQVHDLLQSIDRPSFWNPFQKSQLEQLNSQNPYYAAIAAKFNPKNGDPNAEIPAYELTEPHPMDPRYGEFLKNQLFKIDPSMKKKAEQLRSQ